MQHVPGNAFSNHWKIQEGALELQPGFETRAVTALSDAGFKITVVPKNQWNQPTRNPLERNRKIILSEIIWSNPLVRVTLEQDQNEKEKYWHLRIKTVRAVSNFEELTDNEVLELRAAANKIAQIYGKVFGTADTFEFTPNSPRAGRVGDQFYLEISPGQVFTDKDHVDTLTKAKRLTYVMTGGRYGKMGFSSEKVKEVKAIAGTILEQPSAPLESRDKKPSILTLKWVYHKKAIQFVAKSLLKQLRDLGQAVDLDVKEDRLKGASYIVEKQDLLGEFTASIEPIVKKECVFCKPEIIEKQKIWQGRLYNILYNSAPFVIEKHFLTVSNAHVETIANSNSAEILEEHKLLLHAAHYYKKLHLGSDYKIWRQNGKHAGMTQVHMHSHIVISTPKEALKESGQRLMELTGKKLDYLSQSAFGEVRVKYQSVMRDSVTHQPSLLESPPHRVQ